MVVATEVVEKVDGFGRDEVLVFGGDELAPLLAAVAADQRLQVGVQLDAVFVQIRVQFVSAKHLKKVWGLGFRVWNPLGFRALSGALRV